MRHSLGGKIQGMALLGVGLALLVGLLSCQRRPLTQAPVAPAPRPTAQPARSPAPAFPLTVTDAKGTSVTFPGPPQRIVSMSPPITEILFALGLGDRVVGVTRFCKFPPQAAAKEKIGGIIDPSQEKIVALAPDVVFATVGNPMPVIEALRKAGIRVFGVDPTSYEEVCETIITLGRICGAHEAAQQVVKTMRDTAAQVKVAVDKLPADKRPTALLVVWLDPLFVAGPGTFGDDILRLAGATNAAGQTRHPWKEFSLEMAVAANPQVLVIAVDHQPGDADTRRTLAELRKHPSWRQVSAVKQGRIILVHSDTILQTGPRLAQGLRELAVALHPELFPAR